MPLEHSMAVIRVLMGLQARSCSPVRPAPPISSALSAASTARSAVFGFEPNALFPEWVSGSYRLSYLELPVFLRVSAGGRKVILDNGPDDRMAVRRQDPERLLCGSTQSTPLVSEG
jgi:hypothetical protein